MMKAVAIFILFASFASQALAEIKLGVSAPLTGPNASWSEISVPGLKQAIADINAAGGVPINGKSELIRLEIVDDACDPKQAVQAANKLVGKQVTAVVMASCSGATQAAADVFEDEGMPMLATVASNPQITKQGRKVLLRPASRDDSDADASTRFIARQFAGRKIAVIDDKTTWGKGVADVVMAKLRQLKVEQVGSFQITTGDQDFSALISRLKKEKYELVFPAVYDREAGLLVRQMAGQDFKPLIVGPPTLAMQDFLAIVGPASEGIYFTSAALSDKARAVVAKIGSGTDGSSMYNVQSYAAGEILAQAMARAGTDQMALVSDLHSQTFQTVLGDLKFDDHGDIQDMQFDIMQYQGGKPVRYDRSAISH